MRRQRTTKIEPCCQLTLGRSVIIVSDEGIATWLGQAAHEAQQRECEMRWPIPDQGIIGHELVDIGPGLGCQETNLDSLENRAFETLLGLKLPAALALYSYRDRPDWRMVVLDCYVTLIDGSYGFGLNGYSIYHNGRLQGSLRGMPAVAWGTNRVEVRDVAGRWRRVALVEGQDGDYRHLTWDGKRLRGVDGSVYAEARL